MALIVPVADDEDRISIPRMALQLQHVDCTAHHVTLPLAPPLSTHVHKLEIERRHQLTKPRTEHASQCPSTLISVPISAHQGHPNMRNQCPSVPSEHAQPR